MKEEDESVSVLEQAATSEEPLAGETTGESQETGRGDRLQPIDSETRRRSGDVNSRFLYVVEQGAVLRRNSGHVQVTKGENNLLEVPIVKLQGVLLYGNIQVTTQCIRHLLDEGIWVSFLSRGGRYKGRLQSPHDKGARLRRMQWQRSQDPDFCLEFGRAVVRGKLAGQMKVASAYAKNYLAQTLGEGHRILKESVERLKDVDNLDELRGVEGNASRAYFDLFGRWNRSDLPFPGRHKRNAGDPINVLLNLGYTMVTRELEGLTESAGFDPAIGFYHLPDNDRPSLACDWIEEFRHVLVDRLVLKLINTSVIQPDDFEVHKDKGGVRIRPSGLRKFFDAYEKALTNRAEESASAPGFRSIFLSRLAAMLESVVKGAPYKTHLEPQSIELD